MAPLDGAEFERWRGKAAETLGSAQLMADHDRAAWAYFFAEQAAQLGTKGLLHGEGARSDRVDPVHGPDEVMAPRIDILFEDRPGGLEPVGWIPLELAERRRRKDPIACEADQGGVVVRGAMSPSSCG